MRCKGAGGSQWRAGLNGCFVLRYGLLEVSEVLDQAVCAKSTNMKLDLRQGIPRS